MKRAAAVLGGLVAALAAACTPESAVMDAPDAEVAPPGRRPPQPPEPVVPSRTATSVRFRDTDPTIGHVIGEVKIARASDESELTHYALYWGNALGVPDAPIAVLPATGLDLTYALDAAKPTGQDYILVRTRNAVGDSLGGVSAHVPDGVDQALALWAPQPQPPIGVAPPGWHRTLLLEPTTRKLILAAWGAVPPSSDVEILGARCELDLSACAPFHFNPLPAGAALDDKKAIGAAIDPTAQKLVFVTGELLGAERSFVSRCDFDGTNCVTTELPVPVKWPRLAVDATRAKLIVAGGGTSAQALRCELDATACQVIDLAALAGVPSQAAGDLAIKLDETRGRAFITSSSGIFVCAADFAACAHVAAPPPAQIAIEPATGSLAVVDGLVTSITRCQGDGTACTTESLRSPSLSIGYGASILFDAQARRFLVVAEGAYGGRAAAFRCHVDSAGCELIPLSFRPGRYGASVFDPVTRRLVTAIGGPTDSQVFNTAGPWP